MSRTLLALTLRHPWPWMICSLPVQPKRIENRRWAPTGQLKPGDWFAIHGGTAPKAGTKAGDAYIEEILDDVEEAFEAFSLCLGSIPAESFGYRIDPGGPRSPISAEDCTRTFDPDRYVIPGIVAVARFGGVVLDSDDPWYEGPMGWILSEVVVLPEPVPCRGAQKLWQVPDDAADRVRRQFKAARLGTNQHTTTGA